MHALFIAIAAGISTFGGALAGMWLRAKLPGAHLSADTKDVVRLGMGVVATMTALVLGLVVAASKSSFDMYDKAFKSSAADTLILDRLLARYGDETKEIRNDLRRAVKFRLDATWPEGNDKPVKIETPEATPFVEGIQNQILLLTPQDDSQRWLKSRALDVSDQVLRTRWHVFAGADDDTSNPFLAVIIFWLSVIFASFGLFAPRNGTVLSVMLICAICIAASLFLILEMGTPFTGTLKVSSGPLKYALSRMGS